MAQDRDESEGSVEPSEIKRKELGPLACLSDELLDDLVRRAALIPYWERRLIRYLAQSGFYERNR